VDLGFAILGVAFMSVSFFEGEACGMRWGVRMRRMAMVVARSMPLACGFKDGLFIERDF
jgi:hypothetical protein